MLPGTKRLWSGPSPLALSDPSSSLGGGAFAGGTTLTKQSHRDITAQRPNGQQEPLLKGKGSGVVRYGGPCTASFEPRFKCAHHRLPGSTRSTLPHMTQTNGL